PLSVLLCLSINALMASIFGGLGVTIGFPIPFYISRLDLNSLPSPIHIVLDVPFLKYVNVGLIYLLSTFTISKIWRK
ncbi:MAG: hypothetical protein UW82_C0021G0001, partial [candidate division WWE3 bacterium GW2011_GWC2_44_9]